MFTGLDQEPKSAAIVIEGKKITDVIDYDLSEEMYPDYQVTDYGNQMIMPSFIDAHTHMFNGAVNASDYVCNTLGSCSSQEECVEMVKKFAENHPDLKRIRAIGWFVGAWNDAPLPDKRSLDKVFPDIPVYMVCADGHSFWLNSKAIEECGLSDDYSVENGQVCHLEDGSLSGLLIEPAACAPAMEKYMDFTMEEKEELHKQFQKLLISKGIGALSDMSADEYTDEIRVDYHFMNAMDWEDELHTHIYVYPRLFGYTDFTKYAEFQKEFESEHFHISGVKGFIDGVTETYTGLLLEPYTDCPDTCGEGLPLWPQDKMQQEIIAANKEGIQVRLYCIADGSVRMALDMYEVSNKVNNRNDCRNTIEHIENIHPDDLARFDELKVIPSMQPYHVVLSNNGKIWRIGKERAKLEFPVRSVLAACNDLALGTDYPVVDIDPFLTIYAACTRFDLEGKEICQNRLDQTITMAETLKAYTIAGAKVYGEEERMGTIEKGKLANIIVLNHNLFDVKAEEILNTKVVTNYFEGREVYHEE